VRSVAIVGEAAHGTGVETHFPAIAWEDPEVPFPANLWRTWSGLLARPSRAFTRVPFDRPLARALLFYLIVVIVSAFCSLIVTSIIGVPENIEELVGVYDLGVEISGGALVLLSFFITPFAMLFVLLVNSLVIHLFVAMIVRERRTLGATARALSYSVAPYPLTAVPVVGFMVSSIWILVLTIMGVRAAHETTTGRAAAVVLLPIAIFATLYMLLIALAVALSLTEPL
jgi:hypothetical protein